MYIHRSIITVGILATIASPAMAQTDSSSSAGASSVLEEIMVTARKRSESLQDVPISISAFSATDIEDAGILNVQDIAQLTPV